MKNLFLFLTLATGISTMAQNRQLAELTPNQIARMAVPSAAPDFIELEVFSWGWDNNNVHLDSIDLSETTDTIHMRWVDSRHPHFHMPFNGEVRSHFGWRRSRYHYGVDLKLNRGDTVFAAFDGKIRYARYNHGGYGNLVVMRHYNGIETYYAHLSSFLVDTNEYVRAGTPIGLGGSTGRSTGPHLHFEVRYLGNAIDPEEVIDFETGELKSLETDISVETTFKYLKEMRARHYHRVRSGETLSALARRYHTSVNAICRLNGIRSTDVIRIGQNLRVR